MLICMFSTLLLLEDEPLSSWEVTWSFLRGKVHQASVADGTVMWESPLYAVNTVG